MPVDLDDLTYQVRAQISELFPPAGDGVAPVLAFEPIGLPVPPSAFELPAAPGVAVPALARRRVSALANQVPALGGSTYNRTAFQIDEFYQYLIQALMPSGGAGAGPLAPLLVRARQLYEEGSELDPLNPDDTLYAVDADPPDWYTPDTARPWTTFRFTTTPPPRTLYDSTAGTATIRGTFLFSFDTGTEGTSGDVWWEQMTGYARAMVPQGNAKIADLGTGDFDQIGPDTLTTTAFSTTPISGSDDSTDRLQVGRVFAVRTNAGRFAKVQVLDRYQQPGSFYMIKVRWVTFVPVTSPATVPPSPTTPRLTVVRKLVNEEATSTLAATAPRERFKWAMGITPVIPAPAVLTGTVAAVPTVRATRLRTMALARPALAIATASRVEAAPAQAESLDLEFELLPVTLSRPWMLLGLLADRNWFVPGYRAGEFGRTLLPAIPVTMLLARNLTVSVSGSPDDTPLQAVGFGPFSLAGRNATQHSAAAGQMSATLSVPTPQVIGWLAQPLTGLAPLSDPALSPV